MTDHLANDDSNALTMVRAIVRTLPPPSGAPWAIEDVDEPACHPEDL